MGELKEDQAFILFFTEEKPKMSRCFAQRPELRGNQSIIFQISTENRNPNAAYLGGLKQCLKP